MLKEIFNHPPTAKAVIDSEGNILTYGEILSFTKEIESLIPKRALCFLLCENSCGAIAWTISCIISGRVPLLLSAKQDNALLKSLLEIYEPPFIIVPDFEKDKYTKFDVVSSRLGYTLFRTGQPEYPLHPQLSHLLPTSGSTGSPKLVRHMYSNIDAAALNISTFFKITPEDRPLMVLPLYYTMGLSIIFSHFQVGACILATSQSMASPQFWQFIREQHATSFTGVPYSYQVMDMFRFFRMDFPYLKLLTQGGGKMPKELNLKFAQWCQSTGREWIATYGQSEGTARMAWLPPKWAVEKAGSIGIAVPNGELWLVDQEGNKILDPGIEGEMCYRGRNVTMGYARTREDLLLGDERHGWMRTGDLATFDSDGCFWITGRIGRFLKLYGKRIGLDDCEQLVRSVLPNTEIACTGDDERLYIWTTSSIAADTAKATIAAKTGLPTNILITKIIHELPKSEAGKVLYSKLH